MRTSQNPNRFTPEDPPSVPPELQGITEYIVREFRRLAALTDMLVDGHVEETTVVPNKPRTGMIRLADGTLWNPGAGRGVYWFDEGSGTWKLLG